MRVTLAQANPVVGDIEGNLRLMLRWFRECHQKSDLLIFSELYLSGYPPRDLLSRPAFINRLETAVDEVVAESRKLSDCAVLFGTPRAALTGGVCNSALLISQGEIFLEQHKMLLPSYDVFDETRYFIPASDQQVITWRGLKLGVCICEDAWNLPDLFPEYCYRDNPVDRLAEAGAEVIVNLSASPFHKDKSELRRQIAAHHARKHQVPFVLTNQVGGNDELIFDGGSFILAPDASLYASLPDFEEGFETFELPVRSPQPAKRSAPSHSGIAQVRKALVLGTKDYFAKSGARTALIGLSGGIDSALVAGIAAEALGPEQVYGVTLPGPYSSAGSVDDSRELASRLGIHFELLPMTSAFDSFLDLLKPLFEGRPPDLTEENIQARIRGNLLMALANKFGHLVLATSNKSEMAVGYATLYGDMIGALAVIADLFKTQVYELAGHYNSEEILIPEAIISKPPSAELRPDQKDSDSLPPYETLDRILRLYIEQNQGADEIVATGFERAIVQQVLALVHRSEYKRWQAPPVLRVTHKSFGSGRRLPLAAQHI